MRCAAWLLAACRCRAPAHPSARASSAPAVYRFSPFQSVEVAPGLRGNATEMQVILRQSGQVLQRTDIEQPELTLYERDQTFTAKRLQDTIHVHRRQSQCIGDIELGQR